MTFLTHEMRGDVAVLGLNRPEKRNAISDAFIEELNDAISVAETQAKAAVIFGHGPHFCAGLDLAEHVTKTAFESAHGSRRWHAVFSRIQRGRIPWVAALHGAVVGGGLELASAVHLRVADATAFFALPEGQRGIFVGGGASARTARLMGVARMTDLMLTGRTIDAEIAERWGLVNYITAKDEALSHAVTLAQAAAGNAEMSNFAIIHALPRINDMGTDDGLFVESLMAAMTSTSPEAERRLQEFLSGRAPRLAKPKDA